jgi:hypothetical protein
MMQIVHKSNKRNPEGLFTETENTLAGLSGSGHGLQLRKVAEKLHEA